MAGDKGARFAGKVAVVTGAGRNIGRAEALALAREGARVLVNDIGGAEEVVQEIRAAGGEAVADTHSASSWAGGEAIIDAAIKAFGRIDILVNNAGIVRPAPIQEMTEETWDAVVNISLKAYAATIRFAAPHMIGQGTGGVIVNTGSTSGFGHNGMANYSAAKEGALGLTRTVARDLGRYGVRCNLIRPVSHITGTFTPEIGATIRTAEELGIPLMGTRHLGTPRVTALPEHIAPLVVLLCLPETAHVSGQEFFIMGDELARFDEPEFIRMSYNPGGWTLEAMEDELLLDNLVGDVRNRFVKPPAS
jgi:NAD(P)-dependent dehydrogenase (short-subunit alcohol dehydrogenase family)